MREHSQKPLPMSSLTVDWIAIHRRLDEAKAMLERKINHSPEEKKQILKERARVLAREEKVVSNQEQIEIVEFLLSYERYAIESAWVREVYPLKEITALPSTPPFILGIINVRGQITSVIDMKKLFDLPSRGLTDFNKVIIVTDGKMEFGLLVDAMVGAYKIPSSSLQSSLPTLSGMRAKYLQGITSESLIVLSATKILTDPMMRISQTTES